MATVPASTTFSSRQISTIRTSLLDWYAHNKRALPWRGVCDPYAIWISEIMLQQTTVTAVIPFYERWMTRFPTVAALAASSIDEVLLYWAGLGYYARARNLHRAAQTIADTHGGEMPHTSADLIKLPGIGSYTAAAIASIAFREDIAAVDANVMRVICRLAAISGDPAHDTRTKAAVTALAGELSPPGQAGDFNQALMDLGSSLCLSERAFCDSCPLIDQCSAFRSGTPTAFPNIARVVKTEGQRDVSVAVSDSRGWVLLLRRPETDPLWGGLWELPRVTAANSESLEQAAIRALSLAPGLTAAIACPFGTVKHVVANRKITLHGYHASLERRGASEQDGATWAALPALSGYALSTPQRKLIAQYAADREQRSLDLGDR